MNGGQRSPIFALLMPGAVITGMAALLLVGCDGSGQVRAQAQSGLAAVAAATARLGEDLDRNRLSNAVLIGQYAKDVARRKPELAELAALLGREGTRAGTLYEGLLTRVEDVRRTMPPEDAGADAYVQIAVELRSLAEAAAPAEFNLALTDPLNVLADLSEGALPRVGAISKEASRRANDAANLGAGGQLVGNPNYGQWRTDGGGNSFWVWYGQFALMRDLLGGPRIGYGAWAGGRDYSYYHDYGRRNYTSPGARQRQARVESTARRKFTSEGRNFASPYAKQRRGASTAVARQKFASSYSRPGGQARAGTASMRGFGGGGYRGPRRGK